MFNNQSGKLLAWKAGLYLTPFVFALVLLKWGDKIPSGVIILFGLVVLLLFPLSLFFDIREKGFSTHFREHPFSYLFAVVLCCFTLSGTVVYLVMRPAPTRNRAKDAEKTHDEAKGATTGTTTPVTAATPHPTATSATPVKTPKPPARSQQQTQVGRDQQQAQSGDGGVSQVMKDSPGGVQAGRDAFVFGTPTPPARGVLSDQNEAAISKLKDALAGSKVRLMTLGSSREIHNLFLQLHQLFGAASDKWIILPPIVMGSQSIAGGAVGGAPENGVSCEYSGDKTAGFIVAVQAMKIGGIRCTEQRATNGSEIEGSQGIDILIKIQTRIDLE